jgi:hypothetical protein
MWRIWSRTNRYLYPDRYIKMVPYYLYLHLWSITISDLKKNVKKMTKYWNLTLSPRASILWHSKCIYEVIDMHCSSQCYVGGDSCKCKYCDIYVSQLQGSPNQVLRTKHGLASCVAIQAYKSKHYLYPLSIWPTIIDVTQQILLPQSFWYFFFYSYHTWTHWMHPITLLIKTLITNLNVAILKHCKWKIFFVGYLYNCWWKKWNIFPTHLPLGQIAESERETKKHTVILTIGHSICKLCSRQQHTINWCPTSQHIYSTPFNLSCIFTKF